MKCLQSLSLAFSLLLFSACTSAQEEICLPFEIPLEARIVSENSEQISSARGFFIEDHKVITVAHAFPKNRIPEGFTEIARNSQQDFLLLHSENCGNPKEISSDLGNDFFDCKTGNTLGKGELREEVWVQNSITRFSEKRQNLISLSGDFSPGDSGKPFCSDAGEVLGMLLAVDEGESYILPSRAFSY